MKKILIIGTGYIGTHLGSYLKSKNYSISYLSRSPNRVIEGFGSYYWNPEKEEIDLESLKDVEIIVNLSGDNIAEKRWTTQRKKELRTSRITPLNFLYKILKEHAFTTVKQLVSCSAIGIYDMHDFKKVQTEDSPPGHGFLSDLCVEWEQAIYPFLELGIEVTTLRLGVVVSKDGGMMKKLLNLAKYNLLTIIGSGDQVISWIQMDDLTRLTHFVVKENIRGTYNAVGCNTTNREFTNYINQKTGSIQLKIHLPCWFLRFVMGDSSELLCIGSSVDNTKIIEKGFHFEYPNIQSINL